MKVKLLQVTQNPIDVMWTAARTCYSEQSPNELWENKWGVLPEGCEYCSEDVHKEQQKHWKLVQQVLNSGHQSIAEHVYFTFAIDGISRACSHQLVRHRAGIVFSQQSQRYVEIKEDLTELEIIHEKSESRDTNEKISNTYKLEHILRKYFNIPTTGFINLEAFYRNLHSYLIAIELGVKAEDARQFLPNATKTNIVMSCNYRELIHMCNLRLCTRAQTEIRNLFKEIVKEVKQVDERLATYLVPQCEVNGFCNEHKCCGRKPKLKDIFEELENLRDHAQHSAWERDETD